MKNNKSLKKILASARPEVLAVRLGVSVNSIRNWKEGRNKPSRLAKEKIREIFVEV
jgi:DNA-binding transcriptional regulator YiaG